MRLDARQTLSELLIAYMPSRAIHVAAQLGLPDLVNAGQNSVEAISTATGIDAWRVGRFMRYLVAAGLFRKNGKDFDVTEMGALLCRDAPGSLRDVAVHNYFGFTAWTELEQALRTGEAGYKLSTDRGYFEAMNATPDFAEAFDRAMNAMFVPETKALTENYDFGTFNLLMDVWGGNGEVLIHALKANADLSGRLFDLPHVVDRAAERIAEEGLESRCERVGGSFFDPLPEGADAIFLRHIIHNWQWDDARLILSRAREALEPGGVVMIAEAIIEDAEALTMPIRLDLSMLTYFGAAERTLEEYRSLAGEAGLEITDVTPITPSLSVMEARAASSPI